MRNKNINSVTVFCGSSMGTEIVFKDQAMLLGSTLAERNIHLVYGGANVGLMGAVADGALSKGGRVIGILPDFLKAKEIAHEFLTELILVESMHERKIKMHELSDAVIALPGGFGTLEEFFEMLTWGQLGLHKKPIAVLNINGFYNPLLNLIDDMVSKGFLKEVNKKMLLINDSIEQLLDDMENYQAPVMEKWIKEQRQ